MKKLKIATMVAGQFAAPLPKEIIYAPMDNDSRGSATAQSIQVGLSALPQRQ